MGEDAAQTVAEIEDTRDRLGQEIDELQERLPPPRTVKKTAIGAAAVGATGGLAAWVLLRRRKKRKERKQATAVVRVLPEEWTSRVSDVLANGTWKPWAAGAVAVWVLFRLAELRQLRRINRGMLARAPGI